jgi:hypothetical protein
MEKPEDISLGLETTIIDQNSQTINALPLTTSCVACKHYGKGYENCVSYSWLWGGKARNKEFVDRIVLHKPFVETEAMRNGTENHKILSTNRAVITDVNNIIASIVMGKRTAWSAPLICTTSKGVRGSPDTIVTQLTETVDGYLLEHYIIEDKTFPKSDYSYLPQVWAEAETLSDPNFLIHVNTDTLQDRLEGPSVVFYDVLSQLLQLEEKGKVLHVNVYTVLNFYGGDPKAPKDNAMWIVKGEPKPADDSRAPELFSKDFRVLDRQKSLVVMRQKKSRIGARNEITFNKAARQLRFTSKPRRSINVVDTFPTVDGGTMGLYSPRTADDRREEDHRIKAIQYQMADLANFAKAQEAERRQKVVEELAQQAPHD